MRPLLFETAGRPGYSQLKLPAGEIKAAIFGHPEFTAFNASVTALFAKWKKANAARLNGISPATSPRR